MDVPIVSSRSHGRAAAADAAAVAVAKSDTARSSWCCSSDSPMSGKYEEEYNIFVCESQKVAITIQCVLYAVFYAGFAVSGFAVAGQEGDVNASDVGLQDLCRNNTAANCAAYTDIDSQTSTLFLAAFLNTAMYCVQTALLILGAVFVRRPFFQKRWKTVSTVFISVAAVVGPLTINIWTGLYLLAFDLSTLTGQQFPTNGVLRAVVLDTSVLVANQRYCGMTGLTLLAFAPRFRPYFIVAGLLCLAQLCSDSVQMFEIQQLLVHDMTPSSGYGWIDLASHFNFALFVQPIFSNLVAYGVPIGVLWIFERMLHNSFSLQKTLQKRSKFLFKEAHPFAFRTIKDWVQALSDSSHENRSNGTSMSEAKRLLGTGTPSEIAMRVNPSKQRMRHPWELDALSLVLGEVIGVGSHGQVFRGLYKGNRVAVKTLLVLPTDRGVDQLNDSDRIFAETAAEAEALSKLRHENMMRFYGICFLREQHSIAMVTELCDVDLRTWIDAIGGHTDREIWKVAIQIGKGLVYLHEDAGMVHRDLKPSNILLTQQGVVKLCDFGISSSVQAPSADTTEGSQRFFVAQAEATGTTEYMAPECFDASFQSDAKLRPRTMTWQLAGADGLAVLRPVDIFAFGCIMWELFAQRQIWTSYQGRPDELVEAVRHGDRPDLKAAVFGTPTQTSELHQLVSSCWAADPSARPLARQAALKTLHLDIDCYNRLMVQTTTGEREPALPAAVTEGCEICEDM